MENKIDWLEAHYIADRLEKGKLSAETLSARLHQSLKKGHECSYLTMKVAQAMVQFNKKRGDV